MTSKNKWLSTPYVLWSVMFIIIPLGMIFYYGLTDRTGAFTLQNITAIATAEHAKALWLSLLLSIISTVICFLLAYPLALILSNMKVNQHSFIILIFILPMWMNFLLRTLAWQTLLEKSGVINSVLNFLHLPNINIINTPYAIILGMVYNFLPFMVLPLYNVLSKIDKNVLNASRDLGANSVHTFFRIILPLTLPGIFAGTIQVFIPSLDAFYIADVMGGGNSTLLGNLIKDQFMAARNWPSGAAFSVILILFTLIVLKCYTKVGNLEDLA